MRGSRVRAGKSRACHPAAGWMTGGITVAEDAPVAAVAAVLGENRIS